MRKRGKWRNGNGNSDRKKGQGKRVSSKILKTIYVGAGWCHHYYCCCCCC